MAEQNNRNDDYIFLIPIRKATPGMVLGKDVYSPFEQLIINKDTVLDACMLAKLRFYKIDSIYIYQYIVDEAYVEDGITTEDIKKSKEYIKAKKVYEDSLGKEKKILDEIAAENHDVDPYILLDNIEKIIKNGNTKYQVFNMLLCMKDHDDLTYAHCVNVSILCNIFADWLRFSMEDKEILTLCGALHDLGKLTIPKYILLKPGKLTKEEYEEVQRHVERGYQILNNFALDDRIKAAVLSHHERYDGSGYPHGSKGSGINKFAMITAIADIFEAMTSRRVYREALCPFEVIRYLEEEGYHIFHPKYLLPILERITESYINHNVRLNNDICGRIILVNYHSLSKPIVKTKNLYIDLSKERELRIVEIL